MGDFAINSDSDRQLLPARTVAVWSHCAEEPASGCGGLCGVSHLARGGDLFFLVAFVATAWLSGRPGSNP